MPVKINIQKHAVEARVMGAFKDSLPQLTEEIKNDCNQFCKFDSGELASSADRHSKPDQGKIIWQTAYARRQYWEIRTAFKTVNPNATWRWCEHAKQRYLAKWAQQAKVLLEGNL